jgi:hypothetical protein
VRIVATVISSGGYDDCALIYRILNGSFQERRSKVTAERQVDDVDPLLDCIRDGRSDVVGGPPSVSSKRAKRYETTSRCHARDALGVIASRRHRPGHCRGVPTERTIRVRRGVCVSIPEVPRLNDVRAVHEIVSAQVVDPAILVVVYAVPIGRVNSTISVEIFSRIDPQLRTQIGVIKVKSSID